MNLLIDIGNSRVKWAWHSSGNFLNPGQLVYRGNESFPTALFEPLLDRIKSHPERVYISNVGGKPIEKQLNVWCQEADIEPVFARVAGDELGIRLAYADAAAFGVDRWLAIAAAKTLTRQPFIVMDAGTAMTLDGVDSDGTHLGGSISPGAFLMQESLLKKTSDIGHKDGALSSIFATGTGDAVAVGAWYALAALTDRAMDELERRTGVSGRLFLTGGDSNPISKLLRHPFEILPDLVLRGLAIYAMVHP